MVMPDTIIPIMPGSGVPMKAVYVIRTLAAYRQE